MTEELDILRQYLQRQGLKQTSQREVILKVFLETPKHVTVDELAARVQKADSKIGYSTVYRTLKLFTECGLARESHFLHGRTIFEPGYHAKPHDHLVSNDSERIEEFHHDLIDAVQEKVCRRFGFEPEFRRLEIYGEFSEDRKKLEGKEKVMHLLNDALEREMTMASRYLHQSFIINEPGNEDIVRNFRENVEESTGHATLLGDCIVAAGGKPEVKILEVFKGETRTVLEMMKENLGYEKEARDNYKALLPLTQPYPEIEKLIRRLVGEEAEHAAEMESLIKDMEGEA